MIVFKVRATGFGLRASGFRCKIVGRGQGSDLIFFWTLENTFPGLKSGKTQKLESSITPLIINFFKKLVYSLKEGFNTDISFKKFLAKFSRKSVTLSLEFIFPGDFLTDFKDQGRFGKFLNNTIKPSRPGSWMSLEQ